MPQKLDVHDNKVIGLLILIAILAICLLIVALSPLIQESVHALPPAGAAPRTTVPGTPYVSGQPAAAEMRVVPSSPTVMTSTPVLPVSAQSSPPVTQVTILVPRPYSVSISPVSASARPGDTLVYTLNIAGGEGMTDPVHLSLTAGALFVSQTYDIGDVEPPFPKTLSYELTVPGNIPPGITIKGLLTATGGGQVQSQEITLMVT
jgi:hypothetical protein